MKVNECEDMVCDCHAAARDDERSRELDRCSLRQLMMMVIPSSGTHISCAVHGQHFLRGPLFTLEYHYGIRNQGNIRCERDSGHIGVHCGGDYCWSALKNTASPSELRIPRGFYE